MENTNEGADLPQVNGILTPEALLQINNHQLIDGNTYTCEICGKPHVAPFVRRCFCGLRVCDNCYGEHESGG